MGLFGRIYNDYFMPSRWVHYRAFLLAAQANGYQFVRHQDAESTLATREPRLLFLRHDIDTDLAITRTMFAIEREMGIRSTYYFRNCTANVQLMREILSFGSEVGYHYEEVSDHIKTFGIRRREDVLLEMETIREVFLRNLKTFEGLLGARVHTVASHGDWANRYVGITNTPLINERVRAATEIQLEAYDDLLVKRLNFRAADAMYPRLWKPSSPIEAIESCTPRILLLVHPRHWQRAPLHRFRIDTQRLFEEFSYRLR